MNSLLDRSVRRYTVHRGYDPSVSAGVLDVITVNASECNGPAGGQDRVAEAGRSEPDCDFIYVASEVLTIGSLDRDSNDLKQARR